MPMAFQYAFRVDVGRCAGLRAQAGVACIPPGRTLLHSREGATQMGDDCVPKVRFPLPLSIRIRPRMTPPTDDSISGWLGQLQAGDAAAIQLLWDKFYKRLAAVADKFLTTLPPVQDDGDDVAASVFQSFWRGGKEGRFQNIKDLDEAWWNLFRMAWRKCVDRVRRDRAQKRGGGAHIVSLNGEASHELLEIMSDEPGPEFLASFNEQYFRLLDILPDANTRQIAVLMLQGHSANEIHELTGIAKSTVRRKMDLVRKVWKNELDK